MVSEGRHMKAWSPPCTDISSKKDKGEVKLREKLVGKILKRRESKSKKAISGIRLDALLPKRKQSEKQSQDKLPVRA